MKKRVIVFISGSGSNMEALIKATQGNDYPAKIVAVICDKPDAGGIAKAKHYGLPVHVIERKDFSSKDLHEEAILKTLLPYKPDILCLAGFMRLLSERIIKPFEGKILNIHPSLLPSFKGLHTHERALEAQVKIAGCSVHLVTQGMDEGPILAQAAVPVLETDTSKSLAARILSVEHIIYPAALRQFIEQDFKNTDASSTLFSF